MATADELYAAYEAARAAYWPHSEAATARRLPGDGYDRFLPEDQAEFERIGDMTRRAYRAYLDALPHRWYVVAERGDEADKEDSVWTISRDPHECGWSTDSGCGGYGMTFEDATELADAANAAWRARKDHGKTDS